MSAAHLRPGTSLPNQREWFGTLLALMLLAVALRGAVGWALAQELDRDPDSYRLIANNLAERGIYSTAPPDEIAHPTAYRPPLYPLVLAGCSLGKTVSNRTVGFLHLLMGITTVGLTWFLGRRWGLSRGALLAAVLVLCDPLLLYQSSLLMSETLATCLVTIGLVALTRVSQTHTWQSAAAAGALLALSALCRPALLVWFMFSAAALWILPIPRRQKCTTIAAFGLCGALVLSPWVIRNALQFKRPIVTTTHGGYTLHLANNTSFYRHLQVAPWGEVWDASRLPETIDQPGHPTGLDAPGTELDRDRRHYQSALSTIRAAPRVFAWSCLVRIGRFWRLAPHQTAAEESRRQRWLRHGIGVWYTVLFGFAAGGIWKLRSVFWRSPWIWGVLAIAALTAVHALYWSNLRMRAPVTPFLCLLAALGATADRLLMNECKVFAGK